MVKTAQEIVSSLCCESSYDALYDLQNILKHRRKAGRIHPRNRIIETIVRTKMECLDICLRTSQCASFTLKAVRYKRGIRTAWICLINKEANFSQKMAKHDSKGFIHFSMSASKLQQRTDKKWNCIILDKTPRESDKLKRTDTGWMNFNVSSQELQK
ncbi:hypothetical protein pdam_00023587, partial [Pocillopora damicornis]